MAKLAVQIVPAAERAAPECRSSFKGLQAEHARRNTLLEDYVELIADRIADGGEARQVDIAARLGVAQPTVGKTLPAFDRRRLGRAKALSWRVPH